jgi:deazaflavin-dependent oxidoreductase (nitroreductase family)
MVDRAPKFSIQKKETVMSKIDVDQTVRDLEAGKTPAWITEHLRRYRESGGAEGHLFDASAGGGVGLVTSLLLTTVGRRSGEKRTSPLFYGTASNAYVVIGSKGGADTQPAWYLNLLANPTVEVQVAKEIFTARARIATGKEREQLWAQMVQVYPPYRDYQQKTNREIPVVVLEKQSALT